MLNTELINLVDVILDLNTPASQLRPEVMAFKNILLDVSDFDANPEQGIASGETVTMHGLAISPSNAARCTDDYVRTIQFIRGAHAAVEELLHQGKGSVHLLYAGCGPLAVLLIPLLLKFKNQPVRFTVVDIHEESIQSVNSILNQLSLSSPSINLKCGDAMTCLEDLADKPDVVLVEVMQAGLKTEPQVAVCKQIMIKYPLATLIPESIALSLKWVDPEIEFSQFEENKASYRRDLGVVFKVDKTEIAGWSNIENDFVPAAAITIPDDLDLSGVIQIFTEIQVYKGVEIRTYQSGLTTPLNFDIKILESLGKKICFHYKLLDNPGLYLYKP